MPVQQDVLVVGGGIVGLATARALAIERPGLRISVLEKEARVGSHQTLHNSGVLHSGLYYPPGSAKAQLCIEGRRELTAYCEAQSIPVRTTGKLVIAARPAEVEGLVELQQRGTANGLDGIERLGPRGIRDVEPHAAGRAALLVPQTGVVDFSRVAASLATASEFRVSAGQHVRSINAGPSAVAVITDTDRHDARMLVNCAGLHSDRIAAMAGLDPDVQIVPFRGEYYRLAPDAGALVRSLIYPVPDPRFPFLGVHLTRTINDVVEVGPNAVLALGREHYRGAKPNWTEALAALRHKGLRRLARRYWRPGIAEIVRSRSRRLYARSVGRLVPAITASDLLSGGSGVRAQAMTSHGQLIDDFVFMEGPSSLHVLNAPSPAATASLAIGRRIAARVLVSLDAP